MSDTVAPADPVPNLSDKPAWTAAKARKKKRFPWGTLFTLLLLAAVAAGVYYWFWKRSASDAPQYRTATVTRGEIVQVVTATGQLNAVTNVQVGSQVSGIIQHIYVDYNSPVTNGQIVAQLDPGTFKAQVRQAEGELRSAEASLELARINARRAAELRKNSLIPESDHDQAVADLHQAEAMVMIRQANLERAQVDLDRTTIYAPVDGVVISRNVDVGQTVAASFSAPTLFYIANDLSKMQIDAMVSEADVGAVEVGQDVSFMVEAFPYRTFFGKVEQIRNAPTTNQNVVTYDTVIGVNNSDLKLKPGMTANVSIIVAERENALLIPNGALRIDSLLRMSGGSGSQRSPASSGGQRGGSDRFSRSAPSDRSTGSSSSSSPSGSGGSSDQAGREAMRERFDKNKDGRLDEEERQAMRTEMASQSGDRSRGMNRGDGGSGTERRRGGMGRRMMAEQQTTRTVYALEPNGELRPIRIKVGITDGMFTEVLEGLKEGDEIVVGSNTLESQGSSQRPPSNPFSGGGRGFRGRF